MYNPNFLKYIYIYTKMTLRNIESKYIKDEFVDSDGYIRYTYFTKDRPDRLTWNAQEFEDYQNASRTQKDKWSAFGTYPNYLLLRIQAKWDKFINDKVKNCFSTVFIHYTRLDDIGRKKTLRIPLHVLYMRVCMRPDLFHAKLWNNVDREIKNNFYKQNNIL